MFTHCDGDDPKKRVLNIVDNFRLITFAAEFPNLSLDFKTVFISSSIISKLSAHLLKLLVNSYVFFSYFISGALIVSKSIQANFREKTRAINLMKQKWKKSVKFIFSNKKLLALHTPFLSTNQNTSKKNWTFSSMIVETNEKQ